MERLTTRPQVEFTKCIKCKSKYNCYSEVECGAIDEALKKLKYYEDIEEQGLLLKLPCKVGDEIYLVDFEEKIYDVATVLSIEIDTKDNRILLNSDYEVGTWSEDSYVFYSKVEAEKALARMEK